MIEQHDDLYALVNRVIEACVAEDAPLRYEQNALKTTCSVVNTKSGDKLTFVLARLGASLKVGYAIHDKGDPQPFEVDDIEAEGFTEEFVKNLIRFNLS